MAYSKINLATALEKERLSYNIYHDLCQREQARIDAAHAAYTLSHRQAINELRASEVYVHMKASEYAIELLKRLDGTSVEEE